MLDVSDQGRIGVVTLNRPARRNAMDHDLVDALGRALRGLDADPDIAAIVLRGEAPGFCAGSDLKFIGRLSLEAMRGFEAETGDMARLIGFLDKPVIAAVEGFALGGGFILAISCDLVVSADAAQWHLPEVPIGWLTPWGLKALMARVGPVAARKPCYATEAFDGREAKRLGLVDHVADPGHDSRSRDGTGATARSSARGSRILDQALLHAGHSGHGRGSRCPGECSVRRQLPPADRPRHARAVRQQMMQKQRKAVTC
jgi:enoyl-CoA hydratase/carnithine racemase